MADRDALRKNQVEHQEKDARAQQIHNRSLNKAQAAEITDFLELELENLPGSAIETIDFLPRQP